jgi:hypothetical protein
MSSAKKIANKNHEYIGQYTTRDYKHGVPKHVKKMKKETNRRAKRLEEKGHFKDQSEE